MDFTFDGKMKVYLVELPFLEARIIFMYRSRMFPTRVNFPNRWSKSTKCKFCTKLDTDEHLFKCGGFVDLVGECPVSPEHILLSIDKIQMKDLSEAAKVLLKIHDRLVVGNGDKDLV